MDEDMRKRRNSGMSLVEMLVVIALMAVIVGITGYGLGLVSNKPVDECAKKIETVLNRNRTNSMGKKEAWVEFFLDSANHNRVSAKEHMVTARESNSGTAPSAEGTLTIGADGVKVRMTYKDGSTEELGSTPRRISFRRDSGTLEGDVTNDGKICVRIEIYKGDYSTATHIRVVELDELTGKVTLK